jgi:hypothetical protein
VPSQWSEHLLHNQTALRLKATLLCHPSVVVANVPYHKGTLAAAVDQDSHDLARPQCEPQTDLVDYQIGERWARTSTGKRPKETVT